MSDEIVEYLKKFKVLKGDDSTHTSMGNPAGSYYIPFEELENFMAKYTCEILSGRNMHITEKHNDISPILIDLDFRYEKSSAEIRRLYTEAHLKSFIGAYLVQLEKYVEFTEEPKIYVMEKVSPRYDDQKHLIKDGVHIVISNVVTNPEIQFKVRDLTIESMPEIFSECSFTNSMEDIFDEQVISKNNWLLYGSAKPKSKPYVVTQMYRCGEGGSLYQCEVPGDDILIKELSIRNKYVSNPIREEKREEVYNMEKFAADDERKKIALRTALQNTKNETVKECEDIDLIREFVDILSPKRADSYDSWIRVGWCLRNIDSDLLKDWVTFSMQSSKYTAGECEMLWNQMKEGGLGIKSLHLWAKTDNPAAYEKILARSGAALLSHSMETGLDWDVAQVINHYYQHFYRCVQIKQDVWYHFEGHKWNKCESAYTLRNDMSTKMYDMYKTYLDEWVSKHYPSSPKQELAKIEVYKTKSMIVKNFKSTNYKGKIMKTCADVFHEQAVNEDFQAGLDAKPNLLCFNNGVYDLDESEFREGRPEDCVSLSTNIDYVEFDENDPVFKEINKFLYEIQPEDEKREYILRTLANSLHGANREEKVYFWTGEGGNGKSKLYSLLEQCMGEYAANISVSYITQKRAASNSASPEMVKAIGRRFVVFQEPEENERVNAGLMKEISGNDKIQVRGLYKEADSFKPQFQVIFICNQLPFLPPDDGGTWRRVRKITFDSSFVSNPRPDDPNEFKIDYDLDKKWPEWKVPFMSLLIHYHNKYKDQPIVEPSSVIDATLDYQRGNDEYADFVEAQIERIDPNDGYADSPLTLSDVFLQYKEYCNTWGKYNKDSMRVEGLKRSVSRLYGKGFKMKGSAAWGWKGIRINYN